MKESLFRRSLIDDESIRVFGEAGQEGQKDFKGGSDAFPDSPTLEPIRRTVPSHRRLPSPVFSVIGDDHVFSFIQQFWSGGMMVNSTWYVHAIPIHGGPECRVRAKINLYYPFVGPYLMDWQGAAPDRALAAIVGLLADAFGHGAGLELSTWKIEQSKLDRQAEAAEPLW